MQGLAQTGKKSGKYAEQHPESKLLPLENYSHSPFTLSSKNNRTYSEK